MKILGIVTGILLTLSGIFCFVHPVLTFANLSWVIGVIVLASGIGSAAAWWNARKTGTSSGWEFAGAILTMIAGLLILCNLCARLFTDMALITLFGVWIIAAGILRIVVSLKLRLPWWGFGLAWGIVLLVVGLYALVHPVVSLISLGWCVATIFAAQGINLIFAAASLPKDSTI